MSMRSAVLFSGGLDSAVLLAEEAARGDVQPIYVTVGLAWEGKGQLEKAKTEMLQSLAIRPNTPEILNNLGTVYRKLEDKANALASFEKAVTLRPNYAIARYNLAEAYEPTNPRRALSEYETYLALVEGIPDEAGRIALVQQRVKGLKH